MNSNYYYEDDNNSAMGCVACFSVSPFVAGFLRCLFQNTVDPFGMLTEGPGVPVKPGYCSFIKVKETVTYLLYIKKRLKVLKEKLH